MLTFLHQETYSVLATRFVLRLAVNLCSGREQWFGRLPTSHDEEMRVHSSYGKNWVMMRGTRFQIP
jgi:hypothetical protein